MSLAVNKIKVLFTKCVSNCLLVIFSFLVIFVRKVPVGVRIDGVLCCVVSPRSDGGGGDSTCSWPLCNAIERLHSDNIYSVTNLSPTSPTILTNLVTCTLRGIIHLNDEIVLICRGLKIFLFCLPG